MNLNMITPKNETENLVLSITKNCETLIEQTHRKPEETLEFETYLRILVGLEEDNIRLILKQYNEKFITYELDPGNYTIEDLKKAVDL